jgi:two-component system sensor histidine kinase KdpD
MTFKRFIEVWVYSVCVVAAVTLAAWLLRGHLTVANFSVIYLLVVLTLAIQRGTQVALAAAFLSFLCINFFLIQPYYTFLVADPREVLDLIVFFIVAALAGQLAARARRQAHEARQRAFEQETLYHLTRSVNQTTTPAEVYNALIQVIKTKLKAGDAYILPSAAVPASTDMTVHYALLEAGGKVYGTVCAAFDGPYIRERTRLLSTCVAQAAMALNRVELAERARKSQQFEEADRMKTALLHAVSHDLRTPITIIKTSAHNLSTLNDRLTNTQRIELAEAIEQEADQLDRLVGNLLDMSRLRAGALTLNAAPNSLEEVAGDVAARVYQRLKQQRIVLKFDDDLPLVRFDYGLILQALTNLVENALRYEPPDSQIELHGYIAEGEARLQVANHGETITAEEREHLMEPFFHGKDGHIGLGLPIAKGVVEAHHGRLWLEDTPGGGATFIIALPFGKEAVHEPENSGR